MREFYLLNPQEVKPLFFLILLSLLLEQSCVTIYQNTPTAWSAATDKGKVKIENPKGRDRTFSNIVLIENMYFGEQLLGKAKLDTSRYSAVYLKDAEKSKQQTKKTLIGIPIGIGLFFLIGTILMAN